MRSLMKLVVSPIRYFRERLESPIEWVFGVSALLCYGVLLAVAESARVAGTVGEIGVVLSFMFGVGTLVGVLFLFSLQAGAVVGLGLFSSHGNGWRLVEFSALAVWTQVPMAVITLGFWTMTDFESLRLPSDAGFVAIAEALANRSQQPAAGERTLWLLSAYWSLWYVSLQAAALRVVSGFTVSGAAAAGCLLGLLFVALPWALQRF